MPTLVMIALMGGLMYFMLIRPQKKQQDKVQNMLDSLESGDSIVTIGGLHGVIDEINSEEKTVVLDCEGIYLTFDRRAVARVISKVTTVPEPEASTEPEDLGTNEPTTTEEPEDSED